MDTVTLAVLLHKITQKTKVDYTACIAKDQFNLLDFATKPALIIVNTDRKGWSILLKVYFIIFSGFLKINFQISELPGSHWVCYYHIRTPSGHYSEFFDSYGEGPEYYDIQTPYPVLKINHRVLQKKTSASCGQFCLFYAYHRARGCSLEQILGKLSCDLNLNERIVATAFHSYSRGHSLEKGGQGCKWRLYNHRARCNPSR